VFFWFFCKALDSLAVKRDKSYHVLKLQGNAVCCYYPKTSIVSTRSSSRCDVIGGCKLIDVSIRKRKLRRNLKGSTQLTPRQKLPRLKLKNSLQCPATLTPCYSLSSLCNGKQSTRSTHIKLKDFSS